jgi:tetratricopeptide (TPR) repeat protein
VLARHWTEAGATEPAISEWSRAGDAAQARNAFREAQESYQQAMALLDLVPESPERDLRELELRQSVVWMLYTTRGYAAPETIAASKRAAALAEKSGNLSQLVNSVLSKAITALFSGDLPAAGALADQALQFAIREGSPTILGTVHNLQIMTRFYRGDLAGVEQYFTAVLKFFDDPGFRFQDGGGVYSTVAFASWNAWYSGRIDVARERGVQMMAAVNGNNPMQVAYSWVFDSLLRVFLREYEQAEASAARALDLAEKHQFPQITAWSRFVLGQARAQLGRATEGVALIRRGIAGLLEVGFRVVIPRLTACLAEAQEREGAIADALETVEQALLKMNPKEPYRPEALRLRGELRLKQGQMDLAEADFREAIAVAGIMAAKALELRATMSLARLYAKQGRRDEARSMLAEIYGWFTEGFDTADLKDAKALLDELSAVHR